MSKITNGNNMEDTIDQITNEKELWKECRNTISEKCIKNIKNRPELAEKDTKYLKRLLGVVEYKKSIQSSISQQTFALSLVVLSVLGLNTDYFQNSLQEAFNFSSSSPSLNIVVLIFNLLVVAFTGLLAISLTAGIFAFIREGIYPEYKLITIELAINEIIEQKENKTIEEKVEQVKEVDSKL